MSEPKLIFAPSHPERLDIEHMYRGDLELLVQGFEDKKPNKLRGTRARWRPISRTRIRKMKLESLQKYAARVERKLTPQQISEYNSRCMKRDHKCLQINLEVMRAFGRWALKSFPESASVNQILDRAFPSEAEAKTYFEAHSQEDLFQCFLEEEYPTMKSVVWVYAK